MTARDTSRHATVVSWLIANLLCAWVDTRAWDGCAEDWDEASGHQDRAAAAGTLTRGDAPPAAPAKPVRIVANWTGSADMTTKGIVIPPGPWQIAWLAVPRAQGGAQLTIVICDDAGVPLQRMTSGPLSAKRLVVTPLGTSTGGPVSISVSSVNTYWGVWLQSQ